MRFGPGQVRLLYTNRDVIEPWDDCYSGGNREEGRREEVGEILILQVCTYCQRVHPQGPLR